MLYTIVVILLILWLIGYFGPNVFARIPRSGNFVHVLLAVVVIILILKSVRDRIDLNFVESGGAARLADSLLII